MRNRVLADLESAISTVAAELEKYENDLDAFAKLTRISVKLNAVWNDVYQFGKKP